jgi:hypothetical protein
VYWNEVGPLGPTNRVCAWSFRDEEMIDLLKELMAVSGAT